MAWRRCVAGVIVALLIAMPGSKAVAGDWITKGGSPQRMSVATDPIGLVELSVYWQTQALGESAAQPVVVDGVLYHVAGAHLWKLNLKEVDGPKVVASAVTDEAVGEPFDFHRSPGGRVIPPQSSPTYSPATGILYFGTGYGWVWAYHTVEDWFRPVELELGCPVVGSPVVIHDRGRDIVVVADRPNYPQERNQQDDRPLCPREEHGKVWVVQGLDDPNGGLRLHAYEAPTTKQHEGGFGGFITPSAVLAPPHGDDPSIIIGADGFEGGRAIQLALDRSSDYRPYPVWTVDGPAGFAGNFTSDGVNAYWLDTSGRLWGAGLAKGREPTGWPGYSINLPALIGAKAAFTNTEPAVEIRQGPNGPETHLYVTLRNYSDTGADLRSGRTGNDGAVVAVGPDGQVKWFRKFGPEERHGDLKASMNTAPLALTGRGALVVGDVNGYIYTYSLDTGNQAGGDPRPALIRPEGNAPTNRFRLLQDEEQPGDGPFNFSQFAGVGIDPLFVDGLLITGYNFKQGEGNSGRLVAYRAGEAYDLRWLDRPEPVVLTPGVPQSLQARVQLELTSRSLGQLCQPVSVQWFLTDSEGRLVRSLGETPLPGDLRPQQPHTVTATVTPVEGDPAEGQIVGVIDLPSVYALSAAHTANPKVALARSIAAALGLPAAKSCAGAVAEVVEREGEPGPEGGLANNVLTIDYSRPEPRVIDDPAVMGLTAPEVAETGKPFEVGIYLGYQNNLGRSEIRVPLRLWARPESGGPAPEGAWREVTIREGACCTTLPGTIPGLTAGKWDVIVEIDYPGDTRPENNRAVRRVEVMENWSGAGGGPEGGAITR